LLAAAGGPGLQADGAAVAQASQRGGDRGIVDLAGARFAAAGDVGDLDLPDQRQCPAHQLDQVALADLGVVQVQVQPQPRPADGPDQGQGVGGAGEGHPGVVDGGVQVLQHERDPVPLAQLGEAVQGPGGGEPHRAGDLTDGLDRQALVVQAGAMQVQPRAAEPPGGRDRLPGGTQQFGRAVGVGQGTAGVAGHRGEHRAGAGQGAEVLARPVPDEDLEAQAGDPPDPLRDRQVEEDHLGADGQRKRGGRRGRARLGVRSGHRHLSHLLCRCGMRSGEGPRLRRPATSAPRARSLPAPACLAPAAATHALRFPARRVPPDKAVAGAASQQRDADSV
jgi:hypothetical protein